jgi:type IV pilus assembly protein PilE
MITVAIVGVLAAVAYPSYTEYVNRGRRAELAVQMLSAGQFMERYYTENREYPGESALQDRFKYVPPGASVSNFSYKLTLSARTVSSFTIKAERNGEGVMQGDRCGAFTLDNFGRKSLADYSSDKFASDDEAIEYCWR